MQRAESPTYKDRHMNHRPNVMGPSTKAAGIFLLCVIVLGMFWYVEAGYFDDGKVSGEYVSTKAGITRHLWIKPDHTFAQEDIVDGTVRRATGTWHGTASTGHFWFSNNFIDVPNGARGHDSAEVYATFENWFGLVSITFSNNDLRLHKKLFS
jgi:hypothetical protein